MHILIARVMVRLPLRRGGQVSLRALDTVVRAAEVGHFAALRAVPGALARFGPRAVWGAWLDSASPGARRWGSPLVLALAGGDTAVPDQVVDTAWREWLDADEPALWSLLERWQRAAMDGDPDLRDLSRLALGAPPGRLDAQLLGNTASRFDHPIGELARSHLLTLDHPRTIDVFCAAAVDSAPAAAFCATHHLAPSNEVERALFFVRTGQHEQYRALDPDGALLALGYRAAPAAVRTAVRTAMTGFGDLDTLFVIAGARSAGDQAAPLTAEELDHLVRRLVDEGDWDRLWRLARSMPMADLVDTVHAFTAERTPSEPDDRRLFELVRAADRRLLRSVIQGLTARSPIWRIPRTAISMDELDETISPCSVLTLRRTAGGWLSPPHRPRGAPAVWGSSTLPTNPD